MKAYTGPAGRLFSLGPVESGDWDTYDELGLTAEHIPQLIALATDPSLLIEPPSGDLDRSEAAVHAWRVLAHMQAREAIEPLVGLLDLLENFYFDDLVDELQDALVAFGPAAIPALAAFINGPNHSILGLIAAGEDLSRIIEEHPRDRAQVIEIITSALRASYPHNDPDVNGFWIASLLDLKALESYALIKEVFQAGKVNPSIVGDLEEVELVLGLRERRATPRPRQGWIPPEMKQVLETYLADVLDGEENLSSLAGETKGPDETPVQEKGKHKRKHRRKK